MFAGARKPAHRLTAADLKHDAAKKIVRETNSDVPWAVMANDVFGEKVTLSGNVEWFASKLPV